MHVWMYVCTYECLHAYHVRVHRGRYVLFHRVLRIHDLHWAVEKIPQEKTQYHNQPPRVVDISQLERKSLTERGADLNQLQIFKQLKVSCLIGWWYLKLGQLKLSGLGSPLHERSPKKCGWHSRPAERNWRRSQEWSDAKIRRRKFYPGTSGTITPLLNQMVQTSCFLLFHGHKMRIPHPPWLYTN